MSSQDTNVVDIQNQLKEAISCIICAEIYRTPKLLPCHHTFCLKCLEDMGSAGCKKPGDRMSCPVCRKDFVVPVDGFAQLQHDFKIEALMEISHLAESVTLCDRHENKQLEIYCHDCQTVLCALCYVDSHKTHHGVDIGVPAEGFRQQIRERITNLETCCMEAKQRKEFLAKTNKESVLNFVELEKQVNKTNEELFITLSQTFIYVLSQLKSLQKTQMEATEKESRDIDVHVSSLVEHLAHSRNFLKKGPAFICKTVGDFKKRTAEIQAAHEKIVSRQKDPSRIYVFEKTNLTDYLGKSNLFGVLKEHGSRALGPRSITETIEDLKVQIEALKQIITENKKQITQLRTTLEDKAQELTRESASKVDICNENERLKEEIEKHKKVHQKRQENIKKMQEKNNNRITQMKLSIEKLNQAIEDERARNKTLNEELDKSKILINAIQKERENLDKQVDVLNQQSRRTSIRQQETEQQIEQLEQSLEKTEEYNKYLVSRIDELTEENSSLSEENAKEVVRLREECAKTVEMESKCLRQALEQETSKRDQHIRRIVSLMGELEQEKTRSSLLEKTNEEIKQSLQAKIAECEKLLKWE